MEALFLLIKTKLHMRMAGLIIILMGDFRYHSCQITTNYLIHLYIFRVVQHTPDNNLFFGLRGAGSSLAIVTEFLYILHDEPETR